MLRNALFAYILNWQAEESSFCLETCKKYMKMRAVVVESGFFPGKSRWDFKGIQPCRQFCNLYLRAMTSVILKKCFCLSGHVYFC